MQCATTSTVLFRRAAMRKGRIMAASKDWFTGMVLAKLAVRIEELKAHADALRAAGRAAQAATVDEEVKAVEGKMAIVANLPRELDVTVDPSNRAVTIGNLTFELQPGTTPEPATIRTFDSLAGPVAGTWDVYLRGKRVGWFSISARRKDGIFRVVESRTYDPSLAAPAQADFIAAGWIGYFDAGDSPLPPGAKG